MDDEYKDVYYWINYEKSIKNTLEINDTLLLTKEFNKNFFNKTRKSIEITNFSIMKDDIKNYRILTQIQLTQLQDLTELEKIEIIKTYNIMFEFIKDFIN
jgi:hypothetical protein